jgi:DHA2 family methylenomycin A resistance protein-like MFS transporter
MLGLGVGTSMVGLDQAAPLGWSSPVVVGCFTLSPLILGVFVLVEARSRSPLLSLDMFRRRNFTVPVSAEFFLQTAYNGGFILAPFLLNNEFGYSAIGVTTVLIARPLAYSICGPFAASLATRVGERVTGMVGATAMTASMAVLAYGAGAHNVALVIAGLVLSGAGNGFCQPPFQSSMASAVDPGDIGVASATKAVVGTIGASLGITLMTALRGSASSAVGGFSAAFWSASAIALVAVGLSCYLTDTPRGPLGDEAVPGGY